jgi:protein-L-isoaspartate(D-aspartate) O-methyltransferase
MKDTATLQRRHEREDMVERQLASRGVKHDLVLRAMRDVPREAFLPPELGEFAYDDSALPIAEGQTISQPYIVAVMIEALDLKPGYRVLDVGTGSGYAAAVLSRIAERVYSIERHAPLAEAAERVFRSLGYDNIEVRVGDGSLGWPEAAPFDSIVVAAAGPNVPRALKEQLAPSGRLVIPTGSTPRFQKLLRVTRTSEGFEEEDLGEVRFVPLIGAGAWPDESTSETETEEKPKRWSTSPRGVPTAEGRGSGTRARTPVRASEPSIPELIRGSAEPMTSPEEAELDELIERIGDARVVALGEATHGTSEFYRMRTHITRRLVEEKGFRIVALEADWPDASRVDAWVRGYESVQPELLPFQRFPTWMWRNSETAQLIGTLREINRGLPENDRVGVFGLDLYSMHTSQDAVIRYLEDVDPDAGEIARARYGCLTPWAGDPAAYGRAAITGQFRGCEGEVVAALADLLQKRLAYEQNDGRRFFEAEQNARLVANAERYYRIMYYGTRASWNLRDQHMFDTLLALMSRHGSPVSQGLGGASRAVVWAHNSHNGDASATEMGAHGEHNIGQLARERFGDGAYLVGFGTHAGTVAAAHDWGDPMSLMRVRPSHEASYEHLCHESDLDAFLLPLRSRDRAHARGDEQLIAALAAERLERAIGVVYRPETEMQSHYFRASLPNQFDEYIWFDETTAVRPLTNGGTRPIAPAMGAPGSNGSGRMPAETFPFGV